MSVKILIENHKPEYFAGDTVSGEVLVRGLLSYENGSLHIKLKGISAIRINETWELGITSNSTELICEEHIHRLGPGHLGAKEVKRFPFQFDIPRSTSTPQSPASFQHCPYFRTRNHTLPPSLKIGGFHARGEISYELSAVVAKPEGCVPKSKTKALLPIRLKQARELGFGLGGHSAVRIVYESLHNQTVSAIFQSHKLKSEQVTEAPFEVQYDYSIARYDTPSAAISRILEQRVGTRKSLRTIISFYIQVEAPTTMVTGLEAPLTLKFRYDYNKSTMEVLPEIRFLSLKHTIKAHLRFQTQQTNIPPSRKKTSREIFSKTINCPIILKHGTNLSLGDSMNAIVPVGEMSSFTSYNISHMFTSETEVTVQCGGLMQTLKFGKKDVKVLPKKVLRRLEGGVEGDLKSSRISVASQWSADMDVPLTPSICS